MKSILCLFLTVLLMNHLSAQTQFFVSPSGKDTNKGSREKPFATIARAQLEVRNTHGSAVVYLRGGNYYLSSPIVFTYGDSRIGNDSVVYRNFENEKVVISGGILLKPEWKEFKNGIQRTKVPAGLIFDQLFVNGQLQRMARYPNFDPDARFLGGTAADAVSKEKAAGWANLEGGYVHALHKHEWGDFHYIIKGKDAGGELILEGGWQNNRKMGMHDKHRFVDNIFEELDTAGEWFYDKKEQFLYFYPPKSVDLKTAVIEIPQIKHLFEFRGSEKSPVTNITIEGVELTQTLRTFMENKEPLLRSDWTTYRGGAVFFDGTESCYIRNCDFTGLGGNAVYFNKYNRKCEVSGCLFSNIGANAVSFVGDPDAVRSPSFEYNEFVPIKEIDRIPGPKTNNFPAECEVYDNLMFDLGLTEKQSAGIQISMSFGITVSHNTIYDVPRAGINISEGTWGGHIIEFNDVFNTVKESGDHGSFNSWGRDRYWNPNKKLLDSIVESSPDLALLDVISPVIIRNNRMRCDHGWDIDLDDGSSNYHIYNNLLLNGGLKLREGVKRTVENNIIINNSFHPHVWFKNSGDVFVRNIVSTGYLPIWVNSWGKETDYNCFPDSVSLNASINRNTDLNSVYGNPQFVNPQLGNFRVKEGSPALKVGFKNFDMESFGVVSPRLKAMAKKVPLPEVLSLGNLSTDETVDFSGAKIKNLTTLGEQSATGMDEIRGVLVLSVPESCKMAGFLQPNDVILSLNAKITNTVRDLLQARMSVIGSGSEMVVFRNQKEVKVWVDFK